MTRREIEQDRLKRDARINVGFGNGVSFQEGIVVGGDSSSTDQGSIGLVIPWMGCKHIKICVGTE